MEKIKSIDYIKAFAIITVILSHLGIPIETDKKSRLQILKRLCVKWC